MGFSKFITLALLATVLVASVESHGHGDCSFDYSSYGGSQKKFNIILKKDSMTAKSHFEWLKNCCNKSVKHVSHEDLSQDCEEDVARDFSVEDSLYGYTAYFDPKFVENHLKDHEDIKTAEEDGEMSIQHNHYNHHRRLRTSVRKNPTPNLDRIDQKTFPLDGKYRFPATAGRGVTMYIVDTGIFIEHNEFEGRAKFGKATCAGCLEIDDHGHGTHVAGITGGKTFGVANKIKLIAVKVLNAAGSGQFSEVIAGLSFVLNDHKSKPGQKSVVNMSLGGGFSQAVNDAVKSLTDEGIHTAVAAGNDGEDACNTSPASEKSAITVGATEDTSDNVTNFSSIGKCLDIFAPGRNVKSAGITAKDSTQVFSGTSQATPHVAGTVALIIAEFGNAPAAEMVKTLIKFATKGVIPEETLKGSPNVFLRVPFKNYKHY